MDVDELYPIGREAKIEGARKGGNVATGRTTTD